MTEATIEYFGKAVASSARKLLPDTVVPEHSASLNGTIAENLAAVSLADPESALAVIDSVIAAVREGGIGVSAADISDALRLSDDLVLRSAASVLKETQESESAHADLGLMEKIQFRTFGGGDRVKQARKEAKEALAAKETDTKSGEQNKRLDDGIDAMIITEVSKVSPTFASVVARERALAEVAEAMEKLRSSAESYAIASAAYMVPAAKVGKPEIDNALQTAHDSAFTTARIIFADAQEAADRARSQFADVQSDQTVDWNAIAAFVQVLAPASVLLHQPALTAEVSIMQNFVAVTGITEGNRIAEEAKAQGAVFQEQLNATSSVIHSTVHKIREDLGVL